MLERVARLRVLYGLHPEGWRELDFGGWTDEGRQCLFRRFVCDRDGAAASELMERFVDVPSPDLASVVLESTLGPAAPLLALRSDFPARVLEFLGRATESEGGGWLALRDALDEALASAARFRWPRRLARMVCAARSRSAAGGEALVDRMRRVQELDQTVQVLVGGSPLGVLRAQAREAARLALDSATLRVALAHAVPLCRLDPGQPGAERVARRLLANLLRWQRQAAGLLRSWAAAEAAESGTAVAADPPGGHAEHTVLVALNRSWGAAVEEAAEGRSPQLPVPLHMERALNDLSQVLADRALPRWLDHPQVVVPLLRALSRARVLRLRLRPLLRVTLEDRRQPEPVQHAAVRLAASFLSGLGAFEAWSAVAARNEVEGGPEGLQVEQKLIVEMDHELRRLLEEVALDRDRPGAVRSDSLFWLLSCGLSPDEARRLAEVGVQGDEPLVRAVLRWTERHRVHSALEPLRMLHGRRAELSPALRKRLFQALAATGNLAVPEMVTPDVLSGCRQARRAMAALGAPLRTRQLESELQIGRWTAAIRQHDHRRRGLAEQASEHRSQALRLGLQADAAALDAAGHGAAGHAVAAEMQAECAALELLLGSLLEELAQRLVERERLDAACQRCLAEIRALHSELSALRGEMDRLIEGVSEEENRAAALARQAQDADRQLLGARQEVDRLQADLARLSSSRVALESRRRGLGAADRDARERLGRELATLDARMAETGRSLANARARQSALPETIRTLRQWHEQAQARAAGLERRVAELRRGLPPTVHEKDRLSALASQARVELRGLDATIMGLRNRCREVQDRVEDTSRRFAGALRERAARLELALQRQEHLRREGEGHLRQGRECEERVSRHATAMVRLDQQVADGLAAMQRTIPEAAQQVAEMDQRAARAELMQTAVRCRSAELRLNLDLLMHFLERFDGPTPEARRFGDRVGMDWINARVGDLDRKGVLR